jgi:hypothetical protein
MFEFQLPGSAPKTKSNTARNAEALGVARGVSRLFQRRAEHSLVEFKLKTGRRVDVIAMDGKGIFTAVEIKTSVADFRGDRKWREYLPYCDRFYFAVPEKFPHEILPDDCGLMIGDAFEAEIFRTAPQGAMNAARRKAMTLRFAATAAKRLQRYTDPPFNR